MKDESKTEVMNIYNNKGTNDQGTLDQFCEYLSEHGTNLEEDQKVYLAYYWITKNIVYDYDSYRSGTVTAEKVDPPVVFQRRTTVCSGYSALFRKLLLCMNYEESKIKIISGYSKGESYSPDKDPKADHAWNAVEINNNWCLIDTTWDAGRNSEYYLCTPPRCFVRDHLPWFNDEDQFLEKPITLEQFHRSIETDKGYCDYNIEIIEDKAIQNLCGEGKLVIKYKSDEDVFIEIAGFQESRRPEFLLKKKENEFELNLYINDVGTTQFYILANDKPVGPIKFICDEAPSEKKYYPIHYTTYFFSDAQLITPLEDILTIGSRYTFEIRSDDFESLILRIGDYYMSMTKKGNVFKEENVYIHADSLSISNGENTLLYYHGIGDEVDYPDYQYYYGYINKYQVRLYEPITGTLKKGNQYTFKLRCDSESITTLQLVYNNRIIEMDKEGNMYTKTFTIDSTTSSNDLYIRYEAKNNKFGLMYNYKLIS